MAPEQFEALKKIVANNRRFHYESCRRGAQRAPWDYVVLTAANRRQAEGYAMELAQRKDRGFFHEATELVIAIDAGEKRMGSGGATLNALRAVARAARRNGVGPISKKRILVVHCGGSSVRIPHLAPTGKVFAKVPARLPDGVTSTLFDELYIAFAPLGCKISEGLVVLSGDVLLAFPSGELDASWAGVRGIGFLAPCELGAQHGVYVTDAQGIVTQFLQKAPVSRLREISAANPQGKVAVDSGVFMFDRAATKKLIKLAGVKNPSGSLLENAIQQTFPLDLYEDIALALVGEAGRKREGPFSDILYRELSELTYSASVFDSFAFLHMGTTRQYLDALTGKNEAAKIFGAGSTNCFAASSVKCGASAHNVYIDCGGAVERDVVIEDSILKGKLDIGVESLLAGIELGPHMLAAPPRTVISRLPITETGGSPLWIWLIFGTDDNPKLAAAAGGTFLGQPTAELASRLRVDACDIWPPGVPRDLWHARLYPPDERNCPKITEFLLRPSDALRSPWLGAHRFSMSEIFEQINPRRATRFRHHVRGETAAYAFLQSVLEAQDTEASAFLDTANEPYAARPFIRAIEKSMRQCDALERGRLLAAAADAGFRAACQHKASVVVYDGKRLSERRLGPEPIDPATAERLERNAFAEVSAAICKHAPLIERSAAAKPRKVEALAPARLDFGGGWSDTPPCSIERGGAVLNAAIDLDGGPPVSVSVEKIDVPVVRLISRDLQRKLEITSSSHLTNCANPADPFSLVKAAFVLTTPALRDAGRLSEFLEAEGGYEIVTSCRIPLGSGLGTSSIVAASLVASFAKLKGVDLPRESLFDLVLAVEQMITTGGGWQDQFGGVEGGIKLGTTRPGLPQRIEMDRLRLSEDALAELQERTVLFYTGQTRRTKNLLRQIMGSYMLREPTTVRVLDSIKTIAQRMHDELAAGRIDAFGRLMQEHWELNKLMDPHSTTPHIDGLFRASSQFMSGGKLAGAGGGGFMIAVARSASDARKLAQALTEASVDLHGREASWRVNSDGLLLRTLAQ